jgi:isopentenyl phosphate kinase
MDHTVHVVDALRWILGKEFTKVYCEAGTLIRRTLKVDDVGSLHLETEDGIIVSHIASWNRPPSFPTWGDVTLEIVCENGVVNVDAFNQKVNVYNNDRVRAEWAYWGSNPDLGLVRDFIDAVDQRREPRISGVDGSLIESRMKDKEMGYVGVVEKVNPTVLKALLKAGFIPIVSPVSLFSLDRPGDAPAIINVNGDPIAGEIAAALGAKKLIFLTDVDGINDSSGKLISRVSKAAAAAMIASGVISGGMIPKIDACLKALNAGSLTRIIDGRKPHVLLREFEGGDGGTTIHKG